MTSSPNLALVIEQPDSDKYVYMLFSVEVDLDVMYLL